MNINRLGFTSISRSKAENGDAKGKPNFHIVFVHGLRGHPQHTWESESPKLAGQAKGESKPSVFKRFGSKSRDLKDTENIQHLEGSKVYWPRDFLASDLPQAHVWAYGYNADVIGGLFQASDKNSITQHGQDLAVKLERELDNEDPIIFVVHSLGGIVVKDALYHSEVCRRRTKFIVFLGTPHRGSSAADWGRIMANLVKLGLQDSNKHIVESLKVDSEILERIHLEFVRIVVKDKIKIHSFQEGRAMTGIKGFHDKIVGDFSSRLDLGKEIERTEMIDADHRQMTKYSSKDDPGYRAVSGVIKQFLVQYSHSPSLAAGISRMNLHQGAPAAFEIPFSRNPHFVGREDVLKKLFGVLHDPQFHQRIALCGLGGVGKTQIALEFVYGHRQRFPTTSIFWIYASSKQQFESSYSRIAQVAKLDIKNRPDIDKQKATQQWLERPDTPRWLIVVDNADDEDLFFTSKAGNQPLSTLLPQRDGCSILVKTRYKKIGLKMTGREPLEVKTMEPREAKTCCTRALTINITAECLKRY